MTKIPPGLGLPQPVDDDWRKAQEQIDAIVHEHDPAVEEPDPPVEDRPGRPNEGTS